MTVSASNLPNSDSLTARTRKLIELAIEAYDANVVGGDGYETKLVNGLDTMSEPTGKKVLVWLEKQPKKKAAKVPSNPTIITPETTAKSAVLVQEFRDRPTLDGKAPVEFPSDEQKQEILRLVHIPTITRAEKTTVLLFINRLDASRAQELIVVLTNAIEQRQGGAGAAVAQAA